MDYGREPGGRGSPGFVLVHPSTTPSWSAIAYTGFRLLSGDGTTTSIFWSPTAVVRRAFREGSDIDIAVTGSDLSQPDVWRWKDQLEELLFPWTVDMVLVDEQTSGALCDHIRRGAPDFVIEVRDHQS
jgi:predicted nucleotidyltransferase